jgi:hypothetical protein
MFSLANIREMIVSLLGSTALSLLIIKAVGSKFLDTQFQKIIESYRFRITSEFDRISKIHEKEFEILPKIWDCIVNTSSEISRTIAPAQTYLDVTRFNDVELEEVLMKKEFPKEKIEELKRVKANESRQNVYIGLCFYKSINSIGNHITEFDKIYFENKIFLTDEIEEILHRIRKKFISIWVNLKYSINQFYEINYDKVYQNIEEEKSLDKDIELIAQLIKKRLCFDQAYTK